jgi:hypothetical protein
LRRLRTVDLGAWWPLLEQQSRDRLIAHNGEALSTAVIDDITRVNGSVPSSAWWGLDEGLDGHPLSHAGVDWIGAVANGELPQPSPDR